MAIEEDPCNPVEGSAAATAVNICTGWPCLCMPTRTPWVEACARTADEGKPL